MSRPQSQHGVRGRVTNAALIDAVTVLVLTLIAMTAFAGTFDGPGFLIAAAVGAVAGISCAALVSWLRAPALALAVPVSMAVFLIGPSATLRSTGSGWLPDLSGVQHMWSVLVGGWKELLTTLPPIDGTGRLSALPFVLALLSSSVGLLLARRRRDPHLPAIGPAAGLVGAIALGVTTAGGTTMRALIFVVVAVAWGADRRRRFFVATGGGELRRAVTAGVLLGAATTLALLAAPDLTAATTTREVVRDRVIPPVDLSDQPSPLADFRRFRPVSADLADQVLFTVTGLPSGTVVRLATVDSYAGTVWAAGQDGADAPASAGPTSGTGVSSQGRFLRVGARIPASSTGTAVSATVTIDPAYAATPDLRIWLPSVGEPTRLAFTGPNAAARGESLRFNPATGSALVLDGLAAGDTYRVDAVLPDTSEPTSIGAVGTPTAPAAYTGVVAKYVTTTQGGTGGPLSAVVAVAERLRTTGAYTDGVGAEATFLPGHSLGRLAQFLDDTEPAGNDEQYAAALALAADYVGLPSRVVLGAVPDPTGVVHGRDVRAYVEVQVDGQRWWTISPEEFIPSRDRSPTARQQTEENHADAAVVPPPNEQRPPSSVEGFTPDTTSSSRPRSLVEDQGWSLPPWAVLALKVAGFPLAVLLLWVLAVVTAKAVRRARRSRAGTPGDRVAAAWEEIVDVLVDAGVPVSLRHTRPELGAVATQPGVAAAAALADRLTFGPDQVSDEDASSAWAQVRRVRDEVAAGQRRRDRWRGAVSLRSLLPAAATTAEPLPPSLVHRGRLVPAPAGRP